MYWWPQGNRKNSNLYLLLIILLCIPGIFGLIHSGFFISDDGNWMVIRFSAFYEALRHGQFPVRFLPRLLNGYGYPVADFLYPLFMYMGVPIHVIGVGFMNTIKIIFGLAFVFSGIFSFLWLKKLFGNIQAVIGALVYVYFPYHLFDLYKRGSIGEMIALAIIPYIFWQIERKHTMLVGLGIGLLIMAHNSLALLFLPVIILYLFYKQKKIIPCIKALFLGLGIAAFFWIPALYDKQYTVFDKKTVSSITNYFLGISTYYLFGVIGIVGIVAGVVAVFKKHFLGIFFFFILIFSIILALPISAFAWSIFPLGTYIQFPFRFLSMAALSVGFLSAYMVSVVHNKWPLFVGIVVLGSFGFSASSLLVPSGYQYYPDSWYATNQDSTTVQNEYLPSGVKQIPTNRTSSVQIVHGKGELSNVVANGNKTVLIAHMNQSGIIQVNTVYFPGWEIRVDGNTSEAQVSNSGLMLVELPEGTHNVSVYFSETPIRILSDIISLSSVIVLCGYFLIRKKK